MTVFMILGATAALALLTSPVGAGARRLLHLSARVPFTR